jgi:hypothetical protein
LGRLSLELRRTLVYSLERRFPGCGFAVHELEGEFHLAVDTPEPLALEELQGFVDSFRKAAGRMGDKVSTLLLWKNDLSPLAPVMEPDGAWARRTDLPGVFLLGPRLVEVLDALDRILACFAASVGAVASRFPSLLTREHLEKAGYWNRDSQQISSVVPHVSPGRHAACLSPAACLPLYPVLGASGLGAETAFTSRCGVFRWEGGIFEKDPLARLWEYNVREIVVFGGETELRDLQDRYLRFASWLSAELALPAEACTASDTFFHSESVSVALFQLMQQTKLELRVRFEHNPLAVSSFNFHGNHFVKAFAIGSSHPALSSACIGFGLERLAYAVLAKGVTEGSRLRDLERQAAGSPWMDGGSGP